MNLNDSIDLASKILALVLLIGNFVQYLKSESYKSSTTSLIRNWQTQVEGIKNALLGIGQNPQNFTEKQDVSSAVVAIAQSAVALDKAMGEEWQFNNKDEIQKKREKAEDEMKQLFKAAQLPRKN